MKKILWFLMIITLLLSHINYTYANEEKITLLEKELNIVISEFKSIPNDNIWSENFKKKSELNDRILNIKSEILTLKWNVKKIKSENEIFSLSKDLNIKEINISIPTDHNFWWLDTWDILVFSYKNKPWWALASWEWTHAAMMYDNDTIIEAPWYWLKSRKIDLNTYLRNNSSNFKKIFIISMDLSRYQKNDLRNYINNNLVNKAYSEPYNLFSSKYSMNTFYYSSLVWRWHYSSWKNVNLDDIDNDNFVWPAELTISNNIWGSIIARYD